MNITHIFEQVEIKPKYVRVWVDHDAVKKKMIRIDISDEPLLLPIDCKNCCWAFEIPQDQKTVS